eukprot:237911-Pelagomonas_calceolata.AAC.9
MRHVIHELCITRQNEMACCSGVTVNHASYTACLHESPRPWTPPEAWLRMIINDDSSYYDQTKEWKPPAKQRRGGPGALSKHELITPARGKGSVLHSLANCIQVERISG